MMFVSYSEKKTNLEQHGKQWLIHGGRGGGGRSIGSIEPPPLPPTHTKNLAPLYPVFPTMAGLPLRSFSAYIYIYIIIYIYMGQCPANHPYGTFSKFPEQAKEK